MDVQILVTQFQDVVGLLFSLVILVLRYHTLKQVAAPLSETIQTFLQLSYAQEFSQIVSWQLSDP